MIKGQATNREIGLASALMVLLIVYLYFNISNPWGSPVETFNATCTLRGELSCYGIPVLRRGSSMLEISILQNTGGLINVTSFACTSKNVVPVMPHLNNSILIPSGERAYISGGDSGNFVLCTGQDGRSIPNATVGNTYYGNIYINYSFRNGTSELVNGTLVAEYS